MTLSPEFLLKKANFQLSGNSGNHVPNIEWKFFDILFFSFPLPYAKIPLLQYCKAQSFSPSSPLAQLTPDMASISHPYTKDKRK